jgi:endonuclease G, mitochondrial
MTRLFVFLALLVAALPSYAADQRAPLPAAQCAQHVPYGQPVVTKPDAALICRQGYFLYHDNAAKIPVWVAWNITPEHVNGCVARTDAFATDQSLPAGKSATPADYAGSGYDKGHLANDAHQSWDLAVEKESFLMTNMSPQLPGLNRGIWKLLETATGAWTFSRQHTMIVYAGNIYDTASAKKIGAGVVVPMALYKIVIDKNTGETLAFLFPHKENQGNDLTVVQTTVADIEAQSGIVFAVPGDKKAKPALWPVDFKAVADNKKSVCKGS